MDFVCFNYPRESIYIFKKMIKTTIFTGIIVTIPTIYCLYLTWNNKNENKFERSLKFWSIFRVLLFWIQIPLRNKIIYYLNEASKQNQQNMILKMLYQIFNTHAWALTQFLHCMVSLWVIITIFLTGYLNRNYYNNNNYYNNDKIFFCFEGFLSPCLLNIL